MKQPLVPAKHDTPLSVTMFRLCLIALGLSLAALGTFSLLQRHVGMSLGKVVSTHTDQAFSSRRQMSDREFITFTYDINGKTFQRSMPRPANGRGAHSSFVSVYYYEALPGLPWYYQRANGNVGVCIILAAVCAVAVAWSGFSARKVLLARRPAQKK
jgi:hypothetical protein